jgi:hypothetical protein
MTGHAAGLCVAAFSELVTPAIGSTDVSSLRLPTTGALDCSAGLLDGILAPAAGALAVHLIAADVRWFR